MKYIQLAFKCIKYIFSGLITYLFDVRESVEFKLFGYCNISMKKKKKSEITRIVYEMSCFDKSTILCVGVL